MLRFIIFKSDRIFSSWLAQGQQVHGEEEAIGLLCWTSSEGIPTICPSLRWSQLEFFTRVPWSIAPFSKLLKYPSFSFFPGLTSGQPTSLACQCRKPTTYVACDHVRRLFSDLMEHAVPPPQLSLSLRNVITGWGLGLFRKEWILFLARLCKKSAQWTCQRAF